MDVYGRMDVYMDVDVLWYRMIVRQKHQRIRILRFVSEFWPKDPRMVKKYDGRKTVAFFAHGQPKTDTNYNPTYQFSKSKFPDEGHKPLMNIAPSDVTSFRLLSEARATDSELIKLSFCRHQREKA